MRGMMVSAVVGMALGAMLVLGGRNVLAASGRAPSGHPAHGGPAPSAGQTITVIAPRREFTVLDEPPTGLSQGDSRVFHAPLFDASGTRPLGHVDGSCAVTDTGQSGGTQVVSQCIQTYVLPGGTIATQGLAGFGRLSGLPLASTWAVTGGTGVYLGVRGELQFRQQGKRAVNIITLVR
jgi:hypothetical protein